MYGHELEGGHPTPARVLYDELSAAHQGEPPTLTEVAVLELLRLDEPTSDGWNLIERFTGTSGEQTDEALRDVALLMHATRQLILDTNAQTANEGQEAAAQILSSVVRAQLTREGDICPIARALIMSCERTDLIGDDVRGLLEGYEDDQRQRAIAAAVARLLGPGQMRPSIIIIASHHLPPGLSYPGDQQM